MAYNLEIGKRDQKFKVVAMCVVEIDKKIVLVQDAREKYYGRWGLPGGTLRINETVEEAALRGLKEDTGIEGDVDSLVGIQHEFMAEEGHGFIYKILTVRHFSGELRPQHKNILEVKLFDMHDIFKMPDESCRHSELKKVIKDYRRGKRYPQDIIQYIYAK
ncbi:MAG: NUDIX domain-containing protein [Patescibacteria group bacterium]